jgi:hypothetical protein
MRQKSGRKKLIAKMIYYCNALHGRVCSPGGKHRDLSFSTAAGRVYAR